MKNVLGVHLRQIIISLMLLVACVILVTKLFIYAPWFGADTYPLYPKTLGDIVAVLFSSWNYYNSRTSIGFGVEYTSVLYNVLGNIAGSYAQVIVAILWLFIGALGMYTVSRMFKTNTNAALIAALSYTATVITWHEAVNSVYGMLGAYALTPWMLIAIMYGVRSGIIQSYIIGLAAGLVTAPVLTAYYGIFTLLVWLPFALSLALNSLKTRQGTQTILSLLILLIGFMTAYLLPILSATLTSNEYGGIHSIRSLSLIKLEDFKFNYRKGINVFYWLLYPWSLLIARYTVLALPLTLIVGIIVLSISKTRSPYALMPLLGLVITIGFVALAHLASTTNIINYIWSLPLIPFILSALAQPIKAGLVIPLYYSLAIAVAIKNDKKLTPILASLAIITLCIYASWLPIGPKNNVKTYYVEATNLTHYIESINGYNYAYAPFVYVEQGDNYLRNYRVYADNALRPLVKYGPYASNKASQIIKETKTILAAGTIASYIASKTLYTFVYVSNNGTPIIEHFKISPVYVVLPVKIEPYNPKTYGLALAFISKTISSNRTLATKYLKSNIVIDFIPSSVNEINSSILIRITSSSKIIYINGKKATINQFLKYIRKKINNLNNLIIIKTYKVVPPEVDIQVKNRIKIIIVRLNELYSPYWICNKCTKVKNLLFNLYVININKKTNTITIQIIHKLWIVKIISTLLALAVIVYAALLFRRGRTTWLTIFSP